MKIRVQHKTRYTYSEAVAFTDHRMLLRPREDARTRVLDFSIQTDPPSRERWMSDSFGNNIAALSFDESAAEVSFEASLTVEIQEDNPFNFVLESAAENYPFNYPQHEKSALYPYLQVGSPSNCAKVLPWVWSEFPQMPEKTLDLLMALNRRFRERFLYQRRDEEGVQSPDYTIEAKTGSCRDFARLFIEACRQLGMAARFVSGYLYDPPTDSSSHFENVAEGSMHAWAEVYLPGAGWVGFDPTNGLVANHLFIPCAVASEPRLTSPIQGSYSHQLSSSATGVPSGMEVSLTVSEIK